MPLRLRSAGGGSVQLNPPVATSTDVVMEVPAYDGAKLITSKSPGTVLQVVSVSNQTTYSTTSSSYVATFSASITPTSSTSKILVLVNCAIYTGSSAGMGFALTRSGSGIWFPCVADGSGPYGALYATNGGRFLSSMSYLDSPATTSSTSYGIALAARSGQNVVLNPTDGTTGGSTITLMEIAA